MINPKEEFEYIDKHFEELPRYKLFSDLKKCGLKVSWFTIFRIWVKDLFKK